MASMLLLSVAQTPAPTSAAVTSSTSSLLRMENSMSLAIIQCARLQRFVIA